MSLHDEANDSGDSSKDIWLSRHDADGIASQ